MCFAVDGPSGVSMAADEVPDLILMDVALGDLMDGWEATRRRGATLTGRWKHGGFAHRREESWKSINQILEMGIPPT